MELLKQERKQLKALIATREKEATKSAENTEATERELKKLLKKRRE